MGSGILHFDRISHSCLRRSILGDVLHPNFHVPGFHLGLLVLHLFENLARLLFAFVIVVKDLFNDLLQNLSYWLDSFRTSEGC